MLRLQPAVIPSQPHSLPDNQIRRISRRGQRPPRHPRFPPCRIPRTFRFRNRRPRLHWRAKPDSNPCSIRDYGRASKEHLRRLPSEICLPSGASLWSGLRRVHARRAVWMAAVEYRGGASYLLGAGVLSAFVGVSHADEVWLRGVFVVFVEYDVFG